ncbi:Helicase conserved C-terminal domain-containing protein [Plantibacter sp. VKM Ac-1784]|uniref:Helicase conserved C-terminal domain-containing protein n=1 Tax=Plantibacter elymi (nom. nud.) TaxID=199708 RepID=A0ABY1RB46_9MICO|nr:DEAD/DEAH box helicase [Plantibacter sp. VKM Ac-1784]SMQ61607.1 Helicase conserved C-terminal domain-containing protein [Plantibacter sp. VKM Ac-1784]
MNDEEYWVEVSGLAAFTEGVRLSTLKSTRSFFANVRPRESTPSIEWDRHLLAASLVTLDAPETVQSGALRILQGCVQDPDATSVQKAAAEYLLRRLGNGRAAELAHKRGLAPDDDDPASASPLSLDLIRRTLELSVDGGEHRVPVNYFQRQFWSAAEDSRWTSVSAPTSAGKSHIVRLWLTTQVRSHDTYRAVYVVPTRALIDEVSRELETALGEGATVTTMPWDTRIDEKRHELFVLTQERLHILLRKRPEMTFDVIFVDEAQKLNDGSRGVLLQRTLDEAARRGEPTIIFASPLTSNPELLVEGVSGTSKALVSETVTVNQTLIHVNQRPRKTTLWDMVALVSGEAISIGEFDLPARPVPASKRLSLVAVALGSAHSGNVVYANGPGDAEKTAGQICDALGTSDWRPSAATLDVVELIEKTIHPHYLLATYLKQGVAFHYGNMPLLVREAVETLFRNGDVRYLVCTSTLLEGVNLPCQNLFVRAPRKGNNTPMSAPDFWNLAGRAGRWGVEFQGNIVCIDTSDENAWLEAPTRRTRQPMARATDAIARDIGALREYIADGTPVATARTQPILQALFGILASARRQGRELQELPWLQATADEAAELSEIVDASLAPLTVPVETLQLHAGISPISIQRLYDHFRTVSSRDEFDLAAPESTDAVDSYIRAIAICFRFLGADFTDVDGRHFSLALLFVEWMRGRPLAVLIASRIRYLRRARKEFTLAVEIRSVLKDVEQYARFEGPLFLACYADILNEALPQDVNGTETPDIAMMMELGVSRVTEVSMMSLGISRTSVVALSEHIVSDDLTPEQSVEWITSRDIAAFDLPTLVVAEIVQVARRRTSGD